MTGVGFDETARSALADRAKDISDFVTFRSQPGTFLSSNNSSIEGCIGRLDSIFKTRSSATFCPVPDAGYARWLLKHRLTIDARRETYVARERTIDRGNDANSSTR